MVLEHIAVLLGNVALYLLDTLVAELDDGTGFQTDHMIVMGPVGQLEHGRGTFEIVPGNESCLLELRQYAVNGCEAELLATFEQLAVDPLGAEMTVLARLEDFEDFQARRSNFEPRIPEILSFHDGDHAAGGIIRIVSR